jgi:hypothetical protein
LEVGVREETGKGTGIQKTSYWTMTKMAEMETGKVIALTVSLRESFGLWLLAV